MGKPSLFQTLFRQPSQSYASSENDQSTRRTLRGTGTRSSSSLYDDGASIRSGIWDWSSSNKGTGVVAHTNERRLGTGVEQYVRNSRSAATLNLENYDSHDRRELDGRSVRSTKSLASMRSSYQGDLEGGYVPAVPKNRSRKTSSKGWETGASRRYSGIDVPSSSTPSSSTSRHYASSINSLDSTPASSVVSDNRIPLSPRALALSTFSHSKTDEVPPASHKLIKRRSDSSLREDVVLVVAVELKASSPLSNVSKSRFAELEDVFEEAEEEDDKANEQLGRTQPYDGSSTPPHPSVSPTPSSPIISYVSLTITPPTPKANTSTHPVDSSPSDLPSIDSTTRSTAPLPILSDVSPISSPAVCQCGITNDVKPSLPTPRINLTRTASDQETAGVIGDVELSYDSGSVGAESTSTIRAKRQDQSDVAFPSSTQLSAPTKRHSVVAKAPPIPLSTRPQTLPRIITVSLDSTVAPPISHIAPPLSNRYDSVVLETPQWLKSIRSLGEPIAVPAFVPINTTRQPTRSRSQSSSSAVSHDRTSVVYSLGEIDKKPARRRAKSQGLASAESSGRMTPTIRPPPLPRSSSNQIQSRPSSIATPPIASPIVSPSISVDTSPAQSRPSTPGSFDPSPVSATLLRSSTVASEMSRSNSGLSTTSTPLGAFRNAPTRFSIAGTEALKSLSATMTTLSISAGATAALSRTPRSSSLFRRFRSAEKELPAHLRAQAGFDAVRDLKYSASQPPPAKLKHDEVLLDVVAVGLDRSDYKRVVEMTRAEGGFGYIPGRSFYGRVIECGMSVDRLKRGDYVFGMSDLKKSGALAELMTINRDWVTLAPNCDISVEQIAALPLSLHAVQAMESICNELPKGSKILILGAHEGTGSLALQLAEYFRATRDLWIVAQAPLNSNANLTEELERLGASDVALEDSLSLMNRTLAASSFDVVFDTIGGREVYDAGRRVLHAEGRFITTVGDSTSVDEMGAHWKLGMRSLKRSFVKKDQKSISYWAVNLDTRENPREALEKLREAVEKSGVRPPISRVVEFENSASAFAEDIIAGTVVRMH